ncbi:MAG: peptidase S9, partial [Actinobacteria bacterium HGW-Actinobacteria-8]
GESDVAPANLPVLDIPLGTNNDRILDAVLEVVRNLPQDVLDRVESVGAQTEDTVAFTLRDGPRVEWGSSQDSALKAQVLGVMLTSGAASASDVIDVSAPTLPITRRQD